MTAHVQTHPQQRGERIPRALLLGIGALVLASLFGVTALRLAGVEPVAQPPRATAVQVESLRIVELSGGGVSFSDPVTGAPVAALEEGKDGFVRGLLRVLGRVRMQHGVAADLPVEVVRWDDARYSLRDPATGWQIELQGFGYDNLATFAHLMSDISDTGRSEP